MLQRQIGGRLHRLLRLHRKFVPSNRHKYSRNSKEAGAESRLAQNRLANAASSLFFLPFSIPKISTQQKAVSDQVEAFPLTASQLDVCGRPFFSGRPSAEPGGG
jgi:hypothetical protein